MKLIVVVILSLALLELFHCAPLIGSDDGTYTETHTSSSWGFNTGLDANLGLEGGFKKGIASLGTKNHFGFNVGGYKENGQKDLKHAVTAASPPYNFGSVMPNNPANGSPYYIQYAPQPVPQYYPPVAPQFAPQPFQQYNPQQAPQFAPQYAPQYPNAPLYAPQTAPQYLPQAAPQYAPQNFPQETPHYIPQGAPQYAPQASPYYAPQSAPPNGDSNSSRGTLNEEDLQ